MLPKLSKSVLEERSFQYWKMSKRFYNCKFQNRMSFEGGKIIGYQNDCAETQEQFLCRIQVNYLKHNFTDYDYRIHTADNYLQDNKVVYQKIKLAYPHLSDACEKSFSNRKPTDR